MNWVLVGTLFAVALVACCMGFKRFVWFMSVGYGQDLRYRAYADRTKLIIPFVW